MESGLLCLLYIVASVCNLLSSVWMGLTWVGLPAPEWPDLALCQVQVEQVARHSLSLEKHFVKPLIMPRLLLTPESTLRAATWSTEEDLRLNLSCIGVLVAFFFGWHDDTFSKLAKPDIKLTSDENSDKYQ